MAHTPIAHAYAYANCPHLLARKVLVKLIERLKLSVLISKNVPLNKPRECLRSPVLHVLSRRDGKYIVKFFQGSLLRFFLVPRGRSLPGQ